MLKAAAIFKNGMILQRESKVSVFGSTDCKCVKVFFCDSEYSAEVIGNNWMATIDTAASGENLDMTIIGTNDDTDSVSDRIEIGDIMLGEVWLAGGQSNMELELQNSMNAGCFLDNADYDRIRFYNVPKCPVTDDTLYECEAHTSWRRVKTAECRDMSAVAFHFAVSLYEKLNVPVGIIDCYWGGTSATCWVSENALQDVTEAKAYLNEWKKVCLEKSDEQYDEELESFNNKFNSWQDKVNELKKDKPEIEWSEISKIAGECPWPPPKGRKAPFRPYGLHESMVKRIAPYGIKGVIYYQAEEDGERADYYCKLNTAVVKQWRSDFNNERLPFFVTMLPMYISKDSVDDKSWAVLRRQQEKCSIENDNVGIAVVTDCGEFDNIHPLDKEVPGKRLAEQVLMKVYKQDLCKDNLRAVAASFEGSKCAINLENAYGGLCYGVSDVKTLTARTALSEFGNEVTNEAIMGFEAVCGNKSYKPSVSYEKGKIILSVDGEEKLSEIRYGWFNYGVANVYSKTGMPLMPFCFVNG